MDEPDTHIIDARLLLEAAQDLEDFARCQMAYLSGRKRQRGAPGWTSSLWAHGRARDLREAVDDAA